MKLQKLRKVAALVALMTRWNPGNMITAICRSVRYIGEAKYSNASTSLSSARSIAIPFWGQYDPLLSNKVLCTAQTRCFALIHIGIPTLSNGLEGALNRFPLRRIIIALFITTAASHWRLWHHRVGKQGLPCETWACARPVPRAKQNDETSPPTDGMKKGHP